jgi:hypothetical protein
MPGVSVSAGGNGSSSRKSKLSMMGKTSVGPNAGRGRAESAVVTSDAISDSGSETFILARGSTISMIRGAVAGAVAGKSKLAVGTTTTVTGGRQ